jgi:hypothetical protein
MSERAANELDEIENLMRKPSEADKEGEDDEFDEDDEMLEEEEPDAA